MAIQRTLLTALALGFGLVLCDLAMAQTEDPLPSWNDGKSRQSIIDFVAKVTKKGSPDFVPPTERIAVFDNDGTLWVEYPMYTQILFAFDRVSYCASHIPDHQ